MGKQKKSGHIFKKIHIRARDIFNPQNEPFLHTVEWVFILASFFFIGLAMMYYQESKSPLEVKGGKYAEGIDVSIQTLEDQKMFTGEVVPEPVDTTAWDTYQNKWYGFEIQHPDAWKNNTQYKTATEKSAVYETIYKFRKDGEENGDAFAGFDVKIYPIKKVQKIENTNDVHKKDSAPEESNDCSLSLEETKLKDGGLDLKKISVDENDLCYKPAYFYSVTKGSYIYNIIPAIGESGERFSDPEKETSKRFPEFKEAVAAFKFIPIVKPKPRVDPRAGVRKPVAAKIVGGKLVCAKKNDHPKDSHNNKPGHLDLECCLDPDERPNPWCTY
ncbi:MAG: hypothetical protein WC858_05585 [Parcubacteria group bacterium]|jgi:hypothetical protein